MPDLKVIVGMLAALIMYSAALLQLNRRMEQRKRKKQGEGSSDEESDELFPNGDRRKFRAAIARLEERDLRRETAIERIELDVQEISARLRGRGI
jgi:flagellar biosynthesis/type III secretory pathway M-ring protein FliF/YscJ